MSMTLEYIFVLALLFGREGVCILEISTMLPLPDDLQALLDSLYDGGYLPEYLLPAEELSESDKAESDYVEAPDFNNSRSGPNPEAQNLPNWYNYGKAVFVPPESEYKNFGSRNDKVNNEKVVIVPQNHPVAFKKQKYFWNSVMNPQDLRSDFLVSLNDNSSEKINTSEHKKNPSKLDFLIPIPEKGRYPTLATTVAAITMAALATVADNKSAANFYIPTDPVKAMIENPANYEPRNQTAPKPPTTGPPNPPPRYPPKYPYPHPFPHLVGKPLPRENDVMSLVQAATNDFLKPKSNIFEFAHDVQMVENAPLQDDTIASRNSNSDCPVETKKDKKNIFNLLNIFRRKMNKTTQCSESNRGDSKSFKSMSPSGEGNMSQSGEGSLNELYQKLVSGRKMSMSAQHDAQMMLPQLKEERPESPRQKQLAYLQ